MVKILTSSPASYKEIVSGPRIYVVNNIPDLSPPNIEGLTQIYAGRSALSAPPGALTDCLLESPTLPNERWSELSAIYKIWREGPKSDIVGFCHYRRFFNFTNKIHLANINSITKSEFLKLRSDLFELSQVQAVNDGNSIIASELYLPNNVFEWYAYCHSASDYLDIFKLVAIHKPEFTKAMIAHFDRKTIYGSNLFILSWGTFDELCRFWFGILEQFIHLVSWPRIDKYQSRDVAFLAERLFDAWIRTKRDAGHTLHELPIFFVKGLRPD